MTEPLLRVSDLKVEFVTRRGVIPAVRGVSFEVGRGETLGIVGESGSGKSVTALSIVRLLPKPSGRVVAGQILLDGEDLLLKTDKDMQRVRGRRVAMILQDPMSSLNPVLSVGEQVAESIRRYEPTDRKSLWRRVRDSLAMMRIPAPEIRMTQYPHQLSGGMRQRVVGAIALSCHPDLLLADEPTTALDVTIQAQFLQLLRKLRTELELAMIMITHDLTVIAATCDRVAVMYAGNIVETGTVRQIFDGARHPYTIGLLASAPQLDHDCDRLTSIPGQPPDLQHLQEGCPFSPRCQKAMDVCRQRSPPTTIFEAGHQATCWLHVA